MKILWISHLIPYPPKGGVLQRSYNLLAETSKYHDVDLVAFNQTALMLTHFSSNEAGIEEASKQLSKLCKNIKIFDIPCEYKKHGKASLAFLSLFSTNTYTVNWLKSNEAHSYFSSKDISNTSYDAVICDTISLAPYADYLDSDIKLLDHHNIESHMMLRRARNEKNSLLKIYCYIEGLKLKNYEHKTCTKFTNNLTCSELDSKRLHEVCPSAESVVIENGVDLDYFTPRITKTYRQPLRLMFAGRLSAYTNRKAVRKLVHDIWPLIAKEFPDYTLDIVGAGTPKDVIDAANLDEQITIHGFVDDVRDFFEQADLFICPIEDGGGTKLKILDAMAMAMPIIANQEACEGIELVNYESVIFASTPEEYVSIVRQVSRDSAKIRNLGHNARKVAKEKYSYDSIGKRLSDLFSICNIEKAL